MWKTCFIYLFLFLYMQILSYKFQYPVRRPLLQQFIAVSSFTQNVCVPGKSREKAVTFLYSGLRDTRRLPHVIYRCFCGIIDDGIIHFCLIYSTPGRQTNGSAALITLASNRAY